MKNRKWPKGSIGEWIKGNLHTSVAMKARKIATARRLIWKATLIDGVLAATFVWARSPQGFLYWGNVNNSISSQEKY